jgi:hypothetical protein
MRLSSTQMLHGAHGLPLATDRYESGIAAGLASSSKFIGEHSQRTLRGTSRCAARRPSLASIVTT